MKEKRVELIKDALDGVRISQGKVAKELGVTANAVNFWVHGKMASKRISDWFRNKFGDAFMEQITITK